jgi:hypothetical protein
MKNPNPFVTDDSFLSDMAEAAIKAGDVREVGKVITVSAKALKTAKIPIETVKAAGLPTNAEGDIVLPVTMLEGVNGKGMAALFAGKIAPRDRAPEEGKDERTDEQKTRGACDPFNYALDLEFRQAGRAYIMGKLESPEKAIEKAAEALVAVGEYESVDEARAYIVERRKAKGLPV